MGVCSTFLFFLSAEFNAMIWNESHRFATIGSYKLVTATLIGVCGLVWAGFFRDKSEIDFSRLNSRIAKEKEETMRMATIALNASQTAIAIVDEQRFIKMFNSSFQDLSGNYFDTDLRYMQLEDALQLSNDDTVVLIHCFQEKFPRERDFIVDNKHLRLSLSDTSIDPLCPVGGKHVHVVLRDIANEQALAQADAAAQQQALETIAVMQAIGHRLLVPRQGANHFAQAGESIHLIPDYYDDELND